MAGSKNTILVLGIFTLVHIFLGFNQGVIATNEAEKYISQAHALIEGNFPTAPKYFFYLPIIALIAIGKLMGLGYAFVAAVQVLVSGCSLVLFYRAVAKVYGYKPALYSCLGLAAFMPFQNWNFYLYSESLFLSFGLFLYYLLVRFTQKEKGGVIEIYTLLAVLVISRPNGLLFIPPVFLYFLTIKPNTLKQRLQALIPGIIMLASIYFVADKIMHGGEDIHALKPNIEEHIVCFVPTNPTQATLQANTKESSISNLIHFICQKPWVFGKLMVQRLYSFFKFTRPWYSNTHNVLLLSTIIPLYLLFSIGLAKMIRLSRCMGWYTLSLLILYPLGCSFQCDDWSSRFTFPIMPIIFLGAAIGLCNLTERYQLRL